ncbi:MAG: aminomethyl transferase family protein [Candidatus Omnitrophica bacterium]|nr:aminomethyl transferase family protein [Candidatus Omnitrophota bacterium]
MEYEAVRKGVGWFEYTSETAFEMSGKDAVSFLQGMVSNDVKSLREGEGCYAVCLTPVGKMIADLRIYSLSDRLVILLSKAKKEEMLVHFDKFIFLEEVAFNDLEKKMSLLSLQGPLSAKLMEALSGESLSWTLHHHESLEVQGIIVRAFATSHTGEKGYDLLLPHQDIFRFSRLLEEKGGPYGLREISAETQEVLRVEGGIPRFGKDMDESTIPLEAGLEEAISYTKGCYTGQEVIARIKHIGHVNRMLVGLKCSGAVSRGDKVVQEDKEVGEVTSSCYSPAAGSYVALAMVRREVAKHEIPLMVRTRQGTMQTVVTPLPFYGRPDP